MRIKALLVAALVFIALAYLFGHSSNLTTASDDVLAASSTEPLATYGGQPWQGQLSAYPAGHGALPYYHGSNNGVLQWPGGQALYGGA